MGNGRTLVTSPLPPLDNPDSLAPPPALPALAAPYQRAGAAIFDAVILLVAQYLALHWWSFSVVSAGGLIVGWLYLWVAWTWGGATVGQRVMGVRVVTLQGNRLGARRALGRCVAFAIASWPLKIGLLPILWDAKRQGWHDRLAGTLVIRTRLKAKSHGQWRLKSRLKAFHRAVRLRGRSLNPKASTQVDSVTAGLEARLQSPLHSKYFEAPTMATWPQPDWSFARRGWPLFFAAYLAIAILLTWPVAAHFSTHFAGEASDNMVFAWNYWHFREAISQGQSVMTTDLFWWPHTTSLRFHTMQFHNCVLAWPLQAGWLGRRFSLVEIYNSLFLFSFAADATAAYLAAASLTRDRFAAAIAALAFGFCPYVMAHSTGHANLMAAQYLPLFAVAFYGALISASPRDARRNALLAALCLALNAWCDWQYWLFAIFIALVLMIVIQGAASPFGWDFRSAQAFLAQKSLRDDASRRLKYFGAILSGGTLPLLPLLVPMLRESRGAKTMSIPPYFRADLNDWLSFGPWHPLTSRWWPANAPFLRGVEWVVAPGLVALLLALLACWWRPRALQPWRTLSLAAALGACGPALVVMRSPQLPALAPAVLGGAPGNGFSVASVNVLADFARQMRGGRAPRDISQPIVLPFADVRRALPPLKSFRVPARLAIIVALGISMAVAFGLSALREKWSVFGVFFGVACAFLMLAEYRAAPYPMVAARIEPFYFQIGHEPEKYAIVEAPMRPNFPMMSRYEWFQTVHGKPLFAAYISRPPHPKPDYLRENSLLQLAMCERRNDFALGHLKYFEAAPDSVLRAGLRQLQALHARYFIVHTESLDADNLRRLDQILRARLHLKVLFSGTLRVYDLRN